MVVVPQVVGIVRETFLTLVGVVRAIEGLVVSRARRFLSLGMTGTK